MNRKTDNSVMNFTNSDMVFQNGIKKSYMLGR